LNFLEVTFGDGPRGKSPHDRFAPAPLPNPAPRLAGWLALLAVVLVLGGGFLSFRVPYRREQIAIEKLKAHGATIEFPPVTSKWLPPLIGNRLAEFLWGEASVDFDAGNGITEDEWELLQDLRYFTSVGLTRDGIRDTDLHRLSSFQSLKLIAIWAPEVSNAGLKQLGNLPALTKLVLFSQQVDDRGIQDLAKWTRLTALSLSGPRITDASVPDLIRLTKLDSLEVG
jgi:hypothetical protein